MIEGVSKSRGAVQFKNAFGVSDEKCQSDYSNKYGKSNPNTRGNKSSNTSPRDGIALVNSISKAGGDVKTQISGDADFKERQFRAIQESNSDIKLNGMDEMLRGKGNREQFIWGGGGRRRGS